MRPIGTCRHKLSQCVGRNKHAAKHPDHGQHPARHKPLDRSNRDPTQYFRGLTVAVCESLIVHLGHPVEQFFP